MLGKEVKEYIIRKDDIYYNIVLVDEYKNEMSFEDIKDNKNYSFDKIDDFVIGSGMVLAYYSLKEI
jgi:hypothetical protein